MEKKSGKKKTCTKTTKTAPKKENIVEPVVEETNCSIFTFGSPS